MTTDSDHPADRWAKRAVAAVFAAVLGLLGGLAVGIFAVGFGTPLVITIVAATVLMGVLGWFRPGVFLAVLGLIFDFS